jgi:hypothetical protein
MRRIFVFLAVAGLVAFGTVGRASAQGRDITRQPDGILDVEANSEWTGLGVGNFDGNQADDLVFERASVNGRGQPVAGERVFDVLFGPFDARAKGTTPGNRYRPDAGLTIRMATDQATPLTVADIDRDGRDDFILTQVELTLATERVRLAIVFGRERTKFARELKLGFGATADATIEYSRPRLYSETSKLSSDVSVKFGDVNGDHQMDVIIGTDPASAKSGSLSVTDRSEIVVLLGSSVWQTGTRLTFDRAHADLAVMGIGPCYSSLVGVADVTGDGVDDIVAKSCKSIDGVAKQVQVLAGSTDWQPKQGYNETWLSRDAMWRVRTDWTSGAANLPNYFVRDVNSDGVADIAFSLDGTTHVWYGGPELVRHQSLSRSNRVFLNASFGSLSYTRAWRPADLTGDGRNDLLLTKFAGASRDSGFGSLSGQPIYVFQDGRGADLLDVSSAPSDAVWNDPTQVLWGMGDFNGDGLDDLLLGCRSVQDFFYPFVYGPIVK